MEDLIALTGNRKILNVIYTIQKILQAVLAHNKVRAIFEDSKGNFWVGSAGDGLQILDRKTGRFTQYHYDPGTPKN